MLPQPKNRNRTALPLLFILAVLAAAIFAASSFAEQPSCTAVSIASYSSALQFSGEIESCTCGSATCSANQMCVQEAGTKFRCIGQSEFNSLISGTKTETPKQTAPEPAKEMEHCMVSIPGTPGTKLARQCRCSQAICSAGQYCNKLDSKTFTCANAPIYEEEKKEEKPATPATSTDPNTLCGIGTKILSKCRCKGPTDAQMYCNPGQLCLSQIGCVSEPKAKCQTESDCPSGKVCMDIDNRGVQTKECRYPPCTLGAVTTDSCTCDSFRATVCGPNKICEESGVGAYRCKTPSITSDCNSATDCPPGQVCLENSLFPYSDNPANYKRCGYPICTMNSYNEERCTCLTDVCAPSQYCDSKTRCSDKKEEAAEETAPGAPEVKITEPSAGRKRCERQDECPGQTCFALEGLDSDKYCNYPKCAEGIPEEVTCSCVANGQLAVCSPGQKCVPEDGPKCVAVGGGQGTGGGKASGKGVIMVKLSGPGKNQWVRAGSPLTVKAGESYSMYVKATKAQCLKVGSDTATDDGSTVTTTIPFTFGPNSKNRISLQSFADMGCTHKVASTHVQFNADGGDGKPSDADQPVCEEDEFADDEVCEEGKSYPGGPRTDQEALDDEFKMIESLFEEVKFNTGRDATAEDKLKELELLRELKFKTAALRQRMEGLK